MLKKLVDLYPEIKFYSAAFDSAYNTNAFYLLCMHYGINPIIGLNSRSSKLSSNSDFVKLMKMAFLMGYFVGISFAIEVLFKRI